MLERQNGERQNCEKSEGMGETDWQRNRRIEQLGESRGEEKQAWGSSIQFREIKGRLSRCIG